MDKLETKQTKSKYHAENNEMNRLQIIEWNVICIILYAMWLVERKQELEDLLITFTLHLSRKFTKEIIKQIELGVVLR